MPVAGAGGAGCSGRALGWACRPMMCGMACLGAARPRSQNTRVIWLRGQRTWLPADAPVMCGPERVSLPASCASSRRRSFTKITTAWWLSGVLGEDAGAVAGFEDELGLGLPDDAVHGDVLQDKVAQGLGAFGGDVEVEVVVASDVEGLEDAGHAGQVGVEPVDVVPVVAAEPDFD